MTTDDGKVIEAGAAAIERAKDVLSKQPRFTADQKNAYDAMVYWVKSAEIDAPPYRSNSRERDK